MYSKGLFITLSCVLAGIIAAPTNVPLEQAVIPIVSQSEEVQSNGTYKFSYETGNGIIREETAYNKVLPKGRDASSNEGGDSNESEEIHVQRGSYSYTAPDGTIISVRYIADENGFQPIYEHIPSQGYAKSADKSGRALKLDTSESSSGLASRIGSSQLSDVSSAENNKLKTEITPVPVLSPEPETAPETAPVIVPEAVPAVVPEVASGSALQGAPADPEISSVTSTVVEPAAIFEATSSAVPESSHAVVPESTTEVESATNEAANEVLTVSTENAQSVAESGATESSESTTPNVDVSIEVASTAAPDQPSTEPEQDTTASADLTSTSAPEQPPSSEVVESSSSTSAPEQSSTTEAVGQQAIEESVASTPAEEVGQPEPNASEPATPEESTSTIISV